MSARPPVVAPTPALEAGPRLVAVPRGKVRVVEAQHVVEPLAAVVGADVGGQKKGLALHQVLEARRVHVHQGRP